MEIKASKNLLIHLLVLEAKKGSSTAHNTDMHLKPLYRILHS